MGMVLKAAEERKSNEKFDKEKGMKEQKKQR